MHDVKEVEKLYATLEDMITSARAQGYLIILAGDWNADVGTKQIGEENGPMGNCSTGGRDDRGDLFVKWAWRLHLIIANTFFNKGEDKCWSHWNNLIKKKRLIDYICVDSKLFHWMEDSEVNDMLDLGSDHRSVVLDMAIRPKQLTRNHAHKKQPKSRLGRWKPRDQQEYVTALASQLEDYGTESVGSLLEARCQRIEKAIAQTAET
eukprot:10212889-Karenia_brevis.AAC.1